MITSNVFAVNYDSVKREDHRHVSFLLGFTQHATRDAKLTNVTHSVGNQRTHSRCYYERKIERLTSRYATTCARAAKVRAWLGVKVSANAKQGITFRRMLNKLATYTVKMHDLQVKVEELSSEVNSRKRYY